MLRSDLLHMFTVVVDALQFLLFFYAVVSRLMSRRLLCRAQINFHFQRHTTHRRIKCDLSWVRKVCTRRAKKNSYEILLCVLYEKKELRENKRIYMRSSSRGVSEEVRCTKEEKRLRGDDFIGILSVQLKVESFFFVISQRSSKLTIEDGGDIYSA